MRHGGVDAAWGGVHHGSSLAAPLSDLIRHTVPVFCREDRQLAVAMLITESWFRLGTLFRLGKG